MTITGKLGLAASTVLVAGLVALPAEAATQHCAMSDDSVKVETDGRRVVWTDLEEGTVVCVKAGTRITTATVGEDGRLTQTDIRNKNGKPLGISYYVYTPGEEEPPCEPGYGYGGC